MSTKNYQTALIALQFALHRECQISKIRKICIMVVIRQGRLGKHKTSNNIIIPTSAMISALKIL